MWLSGYKHIGTGVKNSSAAYAAYLDTAFKVKNAKIVYDSAGTGSEGIFILPASNYKVWLAGDFIGKNKFGGITYNSRSTKDWDVFIWDITSADSLFTGVVSNTYPANTSSILLFPNPASNNITLQYFLPEKPTIVKILLYDMAGRQVAELYNGRQEAGVHNLQWDISQYPAGMYRIYMQAGDEVVNKALVVRGR